MGETTMPASFSPLTSHGSLRRQELFRSAVHSPFSWERIVSTGRRSSALEGTLLGCMVAEGLARRLRWASRPRIRRYLHALATGKGRGHAIPGDRSHGMIIAAQSILMSRGSIDTFSKSLRRRLAVYRGSRPGAACMAAGRWIASRRFRQHSVVDRGNDPTTRAIMLSVLLQGHSPAGHRWIQRSTTLTHPIDTIAHCSMVIAMATQAAQLERPAGRDDAQELWRQLAQPELSPEIQARLKALEELCQHRASMREAAACLGSPRLSGGLVEDALLGIYAWLRFNRSYHHCILRVLELPGNPVGVAAIAGALHGAQRGSASIPQGWIANTSTFPYGRGWLERYVERTRDWPHGPDDLQRPKPLRVRGVGQMLRNAYAACWQACVTSAGLFQLGGRS